MVEQKQGQLDDGQYDDDITQFDQHVLVHLPDGEVSIAEKVKPLPKSKLICFNCKVMLEYVAGAQHVQCMKCQVVNRVPAVKMSKANCQKCKVLLQFPMGSRKVKCGVCANINQFA